MCVVCKLFSVATVHVATVAKWSFPRSVVGKVKVGIPGISVSKSFCDFYFEHVILHVPPPPNNNKILRCLLRKLSTNNLQSYHNLLGKYVLYKTLQFQYLSRRLPSNHDMQHRRTR